MRLELRNGAALRREDGFTLSEMLTSMAVLGIFMAAAAIALSSAIRHSDEVEDQSVIQAEVRGAIQQFANDFRQAYSGDEATFPIESISPTQVTFLSPDRQAPFHLRRLSYRVSGGELQRARATSTDTDGAPWSIPALSSWARLAGPVSTAAPFTYFDVNGTQLTAFTNPSLVHTVKLRLDVATNSSPSRVFTYSTSVTRRADS
jgi:prepilin-type N-terminal cleavage/methylation domain-containing protein